MTDRFPLPCQYSVPGAQWQTVSPCRVSTVFWVRNDGPFPLTVSLQCSGCAMTDRFPLPGQYSVPSAQWQTVSPYRVSIVFPTRLRCCFGSISSLGVWTKGPRAVYGPKELWERMIVLESLSWIFSALVGTIATRNVPSLHCTVPWPACTLTPSFLEIKMLYSIGLCILW
jgi:hypothetical protein